MQQSKVSQTKKSLDIQLKHWQQNTNLFCVDIKKAFSPPESAAFCFLRHDVTFETIIGASGAN